MGTVRITIVRRNVRRAALRIRTGGVVLIIFVYVTPLQDFIVIVTVIDLRLHSRLRVRLVLVIGAIYIA